MPAFLLPNGKQQFIDINGAPLVGGKVYFYVPNTLTPKDTWQDSAQGVLNTNPVTLDSRGQAVIYGSGTYRQIVTDADGNTIWDQPTQSNFSGSFGAQQSIVSNSTTDLGSLTSNNVLVTGTTTINSFGTSASLSNPLYLLQFSSAGLTITANSTSMVLPNNLSIVTQANDFALFMVTNAGSGYWRLVEYFRANGAALSITSVDTSITSNTTTDLGSVPSHLQKITGTTTITSLGSSATTGNPLYFVKFGGALTLTYDATNLILPGSANITTAANDFGIFEYTGNGRWICLSYNTANGIPLHAKQLVQRAWMETTDGAYSVTLPTNVTGNTRIRFTVQAPGGGGGGASGTGNVGGGGGGGAGGYFQGVLYGFAGGAAVSGNVGGQASAGGTNLGGANGNAASTVVYNAVTLISCAVGQGGANGTAGTSGNAGGSGGAVTTSLASVSTEAIIYSMTGQAGTRGIYASSDVNLAGAGGSTPAGIGGQNQIIGSGGTESANGFSGVGYGSGGGGACGSASVTGGNGQPGFVLIELLTET